MQAGILLSLGIILLKSRKPRVHLQASAYPLDGIVGRRHL
jgi:hypothetical protein